MKIVTEIFYVLFFLSIFEIQCSFHTEGVSVQTFQGFSGHMWPVATMESTDLGVSTLPAKVCKMYKIMPELVSGLNLIKVVPYTQLDSGNEI